MIGNHYATTITPSMLTLADRAVDLCRTHLAKADSDLAAALQAREHLDETDVDAVIRADENVRLCHRNRGQAADRLEQALANVARLRREMAP